METETEKPAIVLRPPRQADGCAIHALVDACKPLDLNSVYSYLLICTHFAETSVVGEDPSGNIASLISAYRPPSQPDVLFVWQVAVGEAARGQGIAKRMLREILARPACQGVRFVETTVTPSNEASMALFHSLARELGTELKETPYFSCEELGGSHEEEHLLRIGPFNETKTQTGAL